MNPTPVERRGAAITLDGLGKSYGQVAAVADLSVRIPAGSFTALLGPSGCGKSTTLSMLAGLTAPDAGDIRFDGVSILGTPAERRPVALVFQKPLLFPHLTVAQNVGFGLRMRHVERRTRTARVQAMLEQVHLDGLAARRVGELSGGQEQRVALARALVLEPRVLLLDEPFSQLDPELRSQMRALVRELHDHAEVTTVFVTHDQGEAIEVADDVLLLLDGRLAGHGPPELFYLRPPTLAAARFFGAVNELTGRVSHRCFRTTLGALPTPTELPDGAAVLMVRPEGAQLAAAPGADTIDARIEAARFAGTHLDVSVRIAGDTRMTVRVPVGTPIEIGGVVHVRIPLASRTVFSTSGR